MKYIGYEYECGGKTVRKLVICKDEREYDKMKTVIENTGLELIEFDFSYKASQVLKGI